MKILFICTHNRCRSILAEAITNAIGEGLLEAASAGSEPAGEIYPLTIKALENHNISTRGLHSKSWNELEEYKADVVITVCSKASREQCPIWFGKSLRAHWSLEDPSKINGSDEEIMAAFDKIISTLVSRISRLVTLLESNPGRITLLNMMNSMGLESETLEN